MRLKITKEWLQEHLEEDEGQDFSAGDLILGGRQLGPYLRDGDVEEEAAEYIYEKAPSASKTADVAAVRVEY